MVRAGTFAIGFAAAMGACQPTTSRPPFAPLPEAAGQELRLPVREATRRLAEALRADTIPIRRVEIRDGYMESPWFDAATGRPTARRPIGPGVVRVRAWADPARPGSSQLTVETLYQPVADPSLPDRELEREVGRDHRIARKVAAALGRLAKRYGAPPPPQPTQPAQPQAAPDQDQSGDGE
jgi:hypothetical protein